MALGGSVVNRIQPRITSAWEFGAQIAGNGALYISRGVQSQTDTTLSSQPAFPLGGSLGVYLGKRRGWLEGWRLRINASIGTIPGLNQGIDLLSWRGGFMISPPLPRYASRNLDIRLELGVLIDGFRLARESSHVYIQSHRIQT